jgi:hypothetical protein
LLAAVACGGGGKSEPDPICVKTPPTPVLVCYDPTGSEGTAATSGGSGSSGGGSSDTSATSGATETGSGGAATDGSTGMATSTETTGGGNAFGDVSGEAGTASASSDAGATGSGSATGSGTGADVDCSEFENGPPDMPADEWTGPYEIEGQCCFYSMGGPVETTSASGGNNDSDSGAGSTVGDSC